MVRIISIIAFTFGYIFYDNYTSMTKVNKINEEIKEKISLNETETIIDKLNERKGDDAMQIRIELV